MATPDVPVPIDRLLLFGERLLARAGVPDEDARLTSRILVEADLRGVESHGVAHLVDFYVRRIQRGEVDPRPNVRVTSDAASAATLDGGRGLGFVVGHRAMSLAIEKARETGIGFVAAGNSTHYGAGAYYAMMALEHDMVGVSMTTGGRMMAVPGGHERILGLNVLAVAAPTSRPFPYVLDMATSVVAAGKFEVARRRGRPVPEGWAVDGDGRPITDPSRLDARAALLPLGGTPEHGAYKGFGLTMMVDILTGGLSGFGTSAEVDTVRGVSHAFAALRIDAFLPAAEYRERMEPMIEAIKRSRTDSGEEVRIPGELEHALADERRSAGVVPVHRDIVAGFRDAAAELDVSFDLTDEA